MNDTKCVSVQELKVKIHIHLKGLDGRRHF